MSIDKWMLQVLTGTEAVGLFSAATFVAQVPVTTLAGGLGPSAYSMAVRATELESRSTAAAQMNRNFVVLFGIICPAAVEIVALSGGLAHLLVGPIYWRAVVQLTPTLAGVSLLSSMRAFYVDTAFQLAHRTKLLTLTTLVGLLSNIMLDLWLIPVYAEFGAALASLFAAGLCITFASVVSRRVYPLPMPWADACKILCSVAVMFWFLRDVLQVSGPLWIGVQMLAGAAIYFACLIALNVSGVRAAMNDIRMMLPFCLPASSNFSPVAGGEQREACVADPGAPSKRPHI